MSDDVARAVGSNGATDDGGIKVAGKICHPRPLTVKELGEVERDCLKRYKRQYLETFHENRDLMDDPDMIMSRKIEETARWDVGDLPAKWVYDPSKIKVTESLSVWLEDNLGFEGIGPDGRLMSQAVKQRVQKQMITTALECELLSEEEYRRMSGDKPRKTKVGYIHWWITGSLAGMITLVWKCFEKDGVTRDEIAEEIGSNPSLMIPLARDIETLTTPAVGNG